MRSIAISFAWILIWYLIGAVYSEPQGDNSCIKRNCGICEGDRATCIMVGGQVECKAEGDWNIKKGGCLKTLMEFLHFNEAETTAMEGGQSVDLRLFKAPFLEDPCKCYGFGIASSDGYDVGHVLPNQNVIYVIASPTHSVVSIFFPKIGMFGSDSITVTEDDGAFFVPNLIDNQLYMSRNCQLHIHYNTGSTPNEDSIGFTAMFMDDCKIGDIKLPTWRIKSPGYVNENSRRYPTDVQCSMKMFAGELLGRPMQYNFELFDIQEDDKIIVDEVNSYTGSTLPPKYTAHDGVIDVVFNSNCKTPGVGWIATHSTYCGDVPDVEHGDLSLDNNSTAPGSTASLTCDDGYKTMTEELECQNDGNWFPAVPTCERVCPTQWLNYGDSCFFIETTEKMSLSAATDWCEEKNPSAAVVFVDDDGENEFIKTELAMKDVNSDFWLSITDIGSASWYDVNDSNKTPIDYDNWATGEPSGDQHCAVFKKQKAYSWTAVNCNVKKYPVCEM